VGIKRKDYVMIKKFKKVASYILELTEEEKDALVLLVKHASGDQVDSQELNSLDDSVVESLNKKLSTEEKMVYGKKGEEAPVAE
jgi:hypothetical protein